MILTLPQLRETLVSRVCPLFAEGGTRDGFKTPRHVGSAVLFRYNKCSLLLTAKHVCDERNGAHLMVKIPGDSRESCAFINLSYSENPWTIRSREFENADVVCIPMQTDIADSLSQEHEFVYPDEIGNADEELTGFESLFILIGFPNSRNKQAVRDPTTGRARKGWGVTAFTAELRQRLPAEFARGKGKSISAHFALRAAKKMASFSGEPDRDAPEFRGMSGGGIWKVHIEPTTKLVERCSLVGVFIEKENQRGIVVLRAVRVEWARDYTTWWQES